MNETTMGNRLTIRGCALIAVILVWSLASPVGATHNAHDHSRNVRQVDLTRFNWPTTEETDISGNPTTSTTWLGSLAFRGRLVIGSVQGGTPPVYTPGESNEGGIVVFRINRDGHQVVKLSHLKCHSTRQVLVLRNLVLQGTMQTVETGTTGSPTDPCDQEGLRIFDLSDPRNPKIAGFVEIPCGVNAQALMPSDEGIYVYVPSTCHKDTDNPPGFAVASEMGVVRVDPEDPRSSSLVRLGSMLPMSGCDDFSVHVDRKLGVCTGDNRFALFDLSDPAAPTPIADSMRTLTFRPGAPAFNWDGSRLALGNVGPYAEWSGSETSVQIFDIEDPSNPVELSTWSASAGPGYDVAVKSVSFIPMRDRRQILTIAHGHRGLWFLDVTEPTVPSELGHYIPFDTSQTYDRDNKPASNAITAHWYNGSVFYGDNRQRMRVFRVKGLDLESAFSMKLYNPQTMVSTSPR